MCHAKNGPSQKQSPGPLLAAINSPPPPPPPPGQFLAAKSGPIADYFCQPKVVVYSYSVTGKECLQLQIMSWMPFHDSGSYIDSSGTQVY